jgi:hypothetical protein
MGVVSLWRLLVWRLRWVLLLGLDHKRHDVPPKRASNKEWMLRLANRVPLLRRSRVFAVGYGLHGFCEAVAHPEE